MSERHKDSRVGGLDIIGETETELFNRSPSQITLLLLILRTGRNIVQMVEEETKWSRIGRGRN